MIIGKTRTNQPVEDEGKVDAQIESLVEGGTLDNAKPIYCHPILLIDSALAPRNINLAIFIFDQNSTAKDWENIQDFMYDVSVAILGNARFPTTGSFYIDSKLYVACHIFAYVNPEDPTDKSIKVEGMTSDGTLGYADLTNATLTAFDGVNKIN